MENVKNFAILGAVLLAGAGGLRAAEKQDVDRIEIVAHVPVSGGPVVQLATGAHWRRNFLYLDHGASGGVTILDVTNAAEPKAAGELNIPKPEATGSLTAVVGTAAVVSSAPAPAPPQTVTILSFADPERPKAERQFEGVTATLKDPYRGLIYLTNAEGLWILRMEPATDMELEREYDKQILYNH